MDATLFSDTPRYILRVDETTVTIRESAGVTKTDWTQTMSQAIELSRWSTHRFYAWHVASNGGMTFCGFAQSGEWNWR